MRKEEGEEFFWDGGGGGGGLSMRKGGGGGRSVGCGDGMGGVCGREDRLRVWRGYVFCYRAWSEEVY